MYQKTTNELCMTSQLRSTATFSSICAERVRIMCDIKNGEHEQIEYGKGLFLAIFYILLA